MWTSTQASRIGGFACYAYEKYATFCSHPSHSLSLSLATEKISRKYCPGKADPDHPHGPMKDWADAEGRADPTTTEAPLAGPSAYDRTRAWVLNGLQTTKMYTLDGPPTVVISERDAGEAHHACGPEDMSWDTDTYPVSETTSENDEETEDEGSLPLVGCMTSSMARSLASSETDSEGSSDDWTEVVLEDISWTDPEGSRHGFTPNGSRAQIAAYRAGRRDWFFAR